ncbi:Na-translocating system protein MpsC family protein, partial [Bacillus solitudinis]
RSELIESGSEQLKVLLSSLTDIQVVSFHTDISTQTGERVIVFTLSENLEQILS